MEKAMTTQKRNFGARVNSWLQEPQGELFRNNKWKFWFIVVAGFALINAGLTALVFNTGGQLQQYMGAVLLGVGALVAWLCVAALHYSDGADKRLSQGVAALDSVALLFTVVHFAFLVWVFGHISTLQSAEREYKAQAEKFNVEARQVQDANVKITEAARAVAQEQTKKARLDNDSIYQARKAAEAGAPIPRRRSAPAAAIGPGLNTSTVELERPVSPTESSTAYLSRWDAYIRLANLAELLLACATLIVIRNRSAATNAPTSAPAMNFDILPSVASRSPVPRPAFSTTHVSSKADDTDAQRKTTHVSSNLAEGLKRLRETLKEISFYTPGRHYKADVKDDCVWIRAMVSDYGVQRTKGATKAKLDILRDAMSMEREAYRERVERFLRQNGFEL
jgi:hypothetical protein